MELDELIKKVKTLKQQYHALNRLEGYKVWGTNEYLLGLQGDVGDLVKRYLAKKGFTFARKDDDTKLGEELADILWDILVIAEELDMDLEAEFAKTLKRIENKIKDRHIIVKGPKKI